MDQVVQIGALVVLGLVGAWLFKVFFIGGKYKDGYGGGYRETKYREPAIKGCAEGCLEMVVEGCFPYVAIGFLILVIAIPIFLILLALGVIRLSDLFK